MEMSRVKVQKTNYSELSQAENNPLSSMFRPFNGCSIGTINVNVVPNMAYKSSTCE